MNPDETENIQAEEPTRPSEEIAAAQLEAEVETIKSDAARDANEEDAWLRLQVVREVMKSIPSIEREGGLVEAFAGKQKGVSIDAALKVSRFVLDGYRDLPGVDK